MGRLFFCPYGTVTQFQTIPSAGSYRGRVGFCLDATGLQSPVQVRLFLALDDGRGSLQHPQCRTTTLSLVQSWCFRLLLALCRFHRRTVPGGSLGTKGNWPSSSGSFDDRCCDLASWISNGTCHSQTCALSTFRLLVDAPDGFGVEVLRRLNDPVNKTFLSRHSRFCGNDVDCPDQSKAPPFPFEFVTRIQESLC